MKKLLVPTDFSDNARHALEVALKLAKRFEAEVTLCSVYDQPSSGQSVLRDLSEQLRESTNEDLEQEVEEVRGTYPDVTIRTRSIQGDNAEMIAKLADLEKADLIVMGKTGRSGLSNKLFGSVALQTIAETNHPVLLIPQDWKYKDITKICLATDLSEFDYPKVLRPLKVFSEIFKAPVELLHFAEDQEALDELYDKGAEAKNQIEQALTETPHRFAFGIDRNVRKAIFDHLDTEDFHMMCMIKHEYPWIHKVFNSSPTVDTAIRTRIPLLILY